MITNWKPCLVNDREGKVVSVESKTNSLKQYGRINNLEITGIPDTVKNNIPKENIQILNEIDLNATSNNIEGCHQIRKTKNHSTKTIVRFFNQNFA